MESGSNDLLFLILFTLLCIPFVLINPLNETSVRIVLGLPLILFFPGYSLIAALFPARGDLDWVERIALSFGLSIAIVPLLGLILNYTPFGIRLIPILITVSSFTILLSVFAYMRRRKLPEDVRFSIDFRSGFKVSSELLKADTRLDRVLTIILIISIIAAISMTVYVILSPKEGEHFTEFYILGVNGTADEYPTLLKVGEEGKLIIGVVNHEYANYTYRIEVKLNESLIQEKSITLSHNETLEYPFSFKANKSGDDQKLEFLLYNNSGVDPYRLHLWVDVNG
ncbi:MAG: hypothetical protein SYNGOMJ08_00393 [Candidatus Syntrophoarchaeum sp. GoM_oil]|nr:MAG: hypothetical protein SYNGOMJ08_00393 [Candidatus Syntrophoarchaeum sp. GoM_oil]